MRRPRCDEEEGEKTHDDAIGRDATRRERLTTMAREIVRGGAQEGQTPAAPIFGAAFASGGFGAAASGGFDPSKFASSATASAKAEGDEEKEGERDEEEDVEAECTKEFKPVVKLEIVEDDSERKTGEEDENVLFEAKVKAYRFTDGEWRERGLGPIKLLEHKDSKKIRVLMRRDKTLKICANFYVQQESKVSEHAASEKACVFTTVDCSDGDERPELYNMCIKFGSAEKRETFTAAFEDAQKKMAALPAEEGEAEAAEEKEAVAKEADALADALSGAKVEDEEKKDE